MLGSFILHLLVLYGIPRILALPWTGQQILKDQEGPFQGWPSTVAPSDAVKLVYQADKGIKFENLAIRPNGQLLITDVGNPKVYQLDPNRLFPDISTVYTFPNATGMTGIIETTPDVFVAVAGIWNSVTFVSTPGSFAIWSIDYTKAGILRGPKVSLIAKMPGAVALNGIMNMPGNPTTVLIADSTKGAVWKLDTASGDHDVAIESPLFINSTYFPLGINGIARHNNDMHFINSAQRIYGKVALNDDGSAAEEIAVLQHAPEGVLAYDDLVIDWEGNAWVAAHPNAVSEITLQGIDRNFTSKGKDIAQPTSVLWGNGSRKKVLYVTCSGDQSVGGQLWALDTCAV